MKKIYLIMLTALLLPATLCSQTVTMSGFTAGGNTQNNTYVVLGQLFASQSLGGDYEVYAGIAQAQLITAEIADDHCAQSEYNNYDFVIGDTIQEGEYTYERYLSAASQFHYDSLTTLNLSVHPIFHVEDTIYFTYALPDSFPTQGVYPQELKTEFGCDSLVDLMVILICDSTATDVDNNTYAVLPLGRYCWTKENMRAQHYADNSDIPVALIYHSEKYADEASNEATYGRLYTWYSAVGLPEDGTPDFGTSDSVQGVCPDGWHVPTESEMSETMLGFTAEELNTVDGWLTPNNNTNSTEFSAVGAGLHEGISDRFKNLLGETAFWTTTQSGDTQAKALSLKRFCSDVMLTPMPAKNAYSVRCIRNYTL
ncbi:MAG: fibrobacter succinogenes major paralogous domain-containing protein [Bacteroidales bacterium]|nr:fibrobacter succinogenes major paralogous domain-containing protein [Bacteroidales bacterium]